MEEPNNCTSHRNLTPQALREHLLEEKEKGRLAFILGNGINRYNPNDLSWNGLIKQVWSDCYEEGISIPSDGISLTELYDMVTLNEISKINPEDTDLNRKIKKVADNIKSRIRERVKEMVCQKIDYHEWLQKRLAKWNVPVLTTNYDTNIESGMKQFVIPINLKRIVQVPIFSTSIMLTSQLTNQPKRTFSDALPFGISMAV